MSGQLPQIHVTGRQLFKRCRRKFLYSEVMKLCPMGGRHVNLVLGDAIHQALSTYYTCQMQDDSNMASTAARTVFARYWQQHLDLLEADLNDPEPLEEAIALGHSMLDRYFEWLAAAPHDTWDKILGVELPIEAVVVTRAGEARLIGSYDMLVVQDGQLWIVDHKGLKSFRQEDELILDDQMTAYLWLADQALRYDPKKLNLPPDHGYRLGGVIYNQLRKKIPSTPELTLKGEVSRRQIDTTPEVYTTFLQTNGFDPADYADVLQKLAGNAYVNRIWMPASLSRLATFHEMIGIELADMLEARVAYPTPQHDCMRMCDYYTLCRIEAEDGDTDIAQEHLFFEDVESPRIRTQLPALSFRGVTSSNGYQS